MAKDFEDFTDDFDSLVEAETEEAPEEIEEVPEVSKKKVPAPAPIKKAPVPVRKVVEPVQEEKLPEPPPTSAPRRKEKQQTPRYTAYKTEKRYGLIDNITGQPVADAADIETLTLTILSDILNKLDRIEASL